jgi:hypothetical protein
VQWHSDYESAHKKALQSNKKLFILLVDKKNQNFITKNFTNQSYIDKINKNFIAIYIQKDQKSSYPIELLYTLEYPSLFFLNNEELYLCEKLGTNITPQTILQKLEQCY